MGDSVSDCSKKPVKIIIRRRLTSLLTNLSDDETLDWPKSGLKHCLLGVQSVMESMVLMPWQGHDS